LFASLRRVPLLFFAASVVLGCCAVLPAADTYRQKVAHNATSIANRFNSLHGLKLLLSRELSALAAAQEAALGAIDELQQQVTGPGGPSQQLIELAGQCGRCRAEMAVAGVVCSHCR
jgi:hypothetical protein